jgi:glycosyltransferase involved in cell wall biosynthesis
MAHYDFALSEALARAGADVTLYTCDETVGEFATYNIKISYEGIYGKDPAWRRGIRYVRGSLKALLGARLSGARIAHFHFFHHLPFEPFNVLLAKLLGFRVVATAHDVQSLAEVLQVPGLMRWSYALSDAIIAQSNVGERELTTVLEVPKSKVAAIPHGNYLDAIDYIPSQNEARLRIGLPSKVRVLLFFGQIKKVKGLNVLLQAMPEVVRRYPDTLLLIAGKEWKDDFQRYQRRIDSLGIASNCVSHIRYIPDTEVPNYYSAADIVILPYTKIYQSGVLLMAMSYGKPVVASDIEGMTEVITEGYNGFLFASGDAESLSSKLIEALSNPVVTRDVGKRGLLYVRERHDWNKIGRTIMELYKSIL